MPVFLFSYAHKGSRYSFELPADSFEDAQARLASLRKSAALDGELEEKIEVSGGSLLFGLAGLGRGPGLPA